jgi:hypothetical protein
LHDRRRGDPILALENAARLSSTRVARTERLLRAAGFAADLGQPETVERLIREADLDQTQPRLRARFAWLREIGQPPQRRSTLWLRNEPYALADPRNQLKS